MALERVAGAEESRRVMEEELAGLQPELAAVDEQLRERERHIEACQEK